AEALAVTEKQPLKLMHHNEGNKTPHIESSTHSPTYIFQQRILHGRSLQHKRKRPRGLSSGPGLFSCFRQGVIIDHRGRKTVQIFFEVTENILSNGAPRANAAATIPQARIAHYAGANLYIALPVKVLTENLINKSLFSLSLDMNQQSRHNITPLRGVHPVRFSPITGPGYNLQATWSVWRSPAV